MIRIEYIKELGQHFKDLLDDEFEKYANECGISCNYTPFNFTVKQNGEAVGILTGLIIYDEIHIGDLIVFQKYRNKGIGTELMKKVESNFENKGFNNINLFTHAFQAPEFYKKCSFELEFTRVNKANPKLAKYFFVKYL